jgi:hypothetical protein
VAFGSNDFPTVSGGNWDSGEHKRVMIHQGQGRMRMLG